MQEASAHALHPCFYIVQVFIYCCGWTLQRHLVVREDFTWTELGLNVLRAGAGVGFMFQCAALSTCRQAVRLIGRFCGGAPAASCSPCVCLASLLLSRLRSRSPQADWKPRSNSPVKA